MENSLWTYLRKLTEEQVLSTKHSERNALPICVGGAAGSSVATGLLAQLEEPVVSSALFSASSGEQDSVEVIVDPPLSEDFIQQREEKQKAKAKTEVIIPVAIEKEETTANAANVNPIAYLFDAARSVKVASAKAEFFSQSWCQL